MVLTYAQGVRPPPIAARQTSVFGEALEEFDLDGAGDGGGLGGGLKGGHGAGIHTPPDSDGEGENSAGETGVTRPKILLPGDTAPTGLPAGDKPKRNAKLAMLQAIEAKRKMGEEALMGGRKGGSRLVRVADQLTKETIKEKIAAKEEALRQERTKQKKKLQLRPKAVLVTGTQSLMKFISAFEMTPKPEAEEKRPRSRGWEIGAGVMRSSHSRDGQQRDDPAVISGAEYDAESGGGGGDMPGLRRHSGSQSGRPHKSDRSLSKFEQRRNQVRRVLDSSAYNWIMLIFIIMWSVILALRPYPLVNDRNNDDVGLRSASGLFAMIWGGKCVASMMVKGRKLFFQSLWNVMDFVVVATYLLEEIVFGAQIRVNLAPLLLRIKYFSYIRSVFAAFAVAAPGMLSILLCLLFSFVAFGILTVNLYGNSLSRRCVTADVEELLHVPERFCKMTESSTTVSQGSCPDNFKCIQGQDNPRYDFASFDHMGFAMISMFQIHTMDSWVNIYMAPLIQSEPDAASFTWIFFIIFFFTVTLTVINLFVAVVLESFAEVRSGDILIRKEALVIDAVIDRRASVAWLKRPMNTNAILPFDSPFPSSPLSPYIVKMAGLRHKAKKYIMARRMDARHMIKSTEFEVMIGFIIAANAVSLALDVDSPSALQVLFALEVFFTVIFAIEMLLKFFAEGPLAYWKTTSNCFDGFVTITSVFSVVFNNSSSSGFSALRVFRLLRVMRLLKLLRQFKRLWQFALTIVRSGQGIFNVAIIMAITMLAFSIIGKGIFGDHMPNYRDRFDDVPGGMITLFQISTGDDWSAVMYEALGGQAPENHSVFRLFFTCCFFALYFIWSTYLMVNILIATVLENMQLSEDEDVELIEGKAQQPLTPVNDEPEETANLPHVDASTTPSASSLNWKHGEDQIKKARLQGALDAKLVIKTFGSGDDGLWGEVVKFFHTIVANPVFEVCMIGTTLLSTVTLTLWGPPGREDLLVSVTFLRAADVAFLGIFGVEATMKLIAHGVRGYFNNPWDRLDFFVLLLSLIDYIIGTSSGGGAKVLRVARCLRPLRLVGKSAAMKNVISTLIKSAPELGYVSLLYLIFVLIFAILGKGFFKDMYWYCNDEAFQAPMGKPECQGEILVASAHGLWLKPRAWLRPARTFDDTPSGFVTLFRATTMKWIGLSWNAMDMTAMDVQPSHEASSQYALFYIFFLAIARYLIINLFVTVIVEHYNEAQSHLQLTPVQLRWRKTMSLVEQHLWEVERPPMKLIEATAFFVMRHKYFKYVITTVLCFDTSFMITAHVGEPTYWTHIRGAVEFLCSIVYVGEIAIEITGYGVRRYFKHGWHILEFTAGIGTFFSVPLAFWGNFYIADLGSRVLRLLRVMRFFQFVGALKQLLQTILDSIFPLLNVFIIMFLVFTIYAVIGVNFFGNSRSGNYMTKEDFQNFFSTVGLLFRMMMQDSHETIMEDAAIGWPMCTQDNDDLAPSPVGDCGNPSVWATAYFISFQVVSVFVLLNLIIAVVANQFTANFRLRNADPVYEMKVLELFREAWETFQPFYDWKGTYVGPQLFDPTCMHHQPESAPIQAATPGSEKAVDVAVAANRLLSMSKQMARQQDGSTYMLQMATKEAVSSPALDAIVEGGNSSVEMKGIPSTDTEGAPSSNAGSDPPSSASAVIPPASAGSSASAIEARRPSTSASSIAAHAVSNLLGGASAKPSVSAGMWRLPGERKEASMGAASAKLSFGNVVRMTRTVQRVSENRLAALEHRVRTALDLPEYQDEYARLDTIPLHQVRRVLFLLVQKAEAAFLSDDVADDDQMRWPVKVKNWRVHYLCCRTNLLMNKIEAAFKKKPAKLDPISRALQSKMNQRGRDRLDPKVLMVRSIDMVTMSSDLMRQIQIEYEEALMTCLSWLVSPEYMPPREVKRNQDLRDVVHTYCASGLLVAMMRGMKYRIRARVKNVRRAQGLRELSDDDDEGEHQSRNKIRDENSIFRDRTATQRATEVRAKRYDNFITSYVTLQPQKCPNDPIDFKNGVQPKVLTVWSPDAFAD